MFRNVRPITSKRPVYTGVYNARVACNRGSVVTVVTRRTNEQEGARSTGIRTATATKRVRARNA